MKRLNQKSVILTLMVALSGWGFVAQADDGISKDERHFLEKSGRVKAWLGECIYRHTKRSDESRGIAEGAVGNGIYIETNYETARVFHFNIFKKDDDKPICKFKDKSHQFTCTVRMRGDGGKNDKRLQVKASDVISQETMCRSDAAKDIYAQYDAMVEGKELGSRNVNVSRSTAVAHDRGDDYEVKEPTRLLVDSDSSSGSTAHAVGANDESNNMAPSARGSASDDTTQAPLPVKKAETVDSVASSEIESAAVEKQKEEAGKKAEVDAANTSLDDVISKMKNGDKNPEVKANSIFEAGNIRVAAQARLKDGSLSASDFDIINKAINKKENDLHESNLSFDEKMERMHSQLMSASSVSSQVVAAPVVQINPPTPSVSAVSAVSNPAVAPAASKVPSADELAQQQSADAALKLAKQNAEKGAVARHSARIKELNAQLDVINADWSISGEGQPSGADAQKIRDLHKELNAEKIALSDSENANRSPAVEQVVNSAEAVAPAVSPLLKAFALLF